MKKVLNKYREFVRLIDKDIKVKKGATAWLSYPALKEIEVPRAVAQSGIDGFIPSVERQLPLHAKHLATTIPDFMWTLLHEVGHIKCEHTKGSSLMRIIADTCGVLGLEKLGNLIYYNLKEEKQATKWAVDFVLSSKIGTVAKYSDELCKAYKRYYKTMNLEEN